MNNNDFFIIAHNIRSLYNVGTIFRTADALQVTKIFLTGYTGCPPRKEISKVAFGAENSVPWELIKNISTLFRRLQKAGIKIIALEKTATSLDYLDFVPTFPIALVLGNEVRGVSNSLLKKCDQIISLPMKGEKESLNVGVAMAVAAYHINSYRK